MNQPRECLRRVQPLAVCVLLSVVVAFTSGALAEDQSPATKPEIRKELEAFVEDYNRLFPAEGITLRTSYERLWMPGQHVTEAQKFTGNFQRVAPDTYEQYGTYEKLTFADDVVSARIDSKVVQHLRIEYGQIALYAIYTDKAGKTDKFGPTGLERLGNGIGFSDASRSPIGFEGSRFFRLRDGSLASTRHWAYIRRQLTDTWTSSLPDSEKR